MPEERRYFCGILVQRTFALGKLLHLLATQSSLPKHVLKLLSRQLPPCNESGPFSLSVFLPRYLLHENYKMLSDLKRGGRKSGTDVAKTLLTKPPFAP